MKISDRSNVFNPLSISPKLITKKQLSPYMQYVISGQRGMCFTLYVGSDKPQATE